MLDAVLVTAIGILVVSRFLGYIYNRGAMAGRQFENFHITRALKQHQARDGEWHDLLGQYRRDVDAVIINSTRAREQGFGCYLFTALHEWYHSEFHRGLITTDEADAKAENEANDFALAVLPVVLDELVKRQLIIPEQAKVPEILVMDGRPQVVSGEALRKAKEVMKYLQPESEKTTKDGSKSAEA